MDSRQIVNRIEAEHPSPSVLEAIMPRLMAALRAVYFPSVPRNILNDASVEYWYTTRSKVVGMPLDQLERDQGGKVAWDAAQPILHEVEALLKENAEGPLFLGKTVSYADFVWAGFLIFIRRNGEDYFEELLRISGDAKLHKDLLDAIAPYSARNNY
jgi:glutathione S-transferase